MEYESTLDWVIRDYWWAFAIGAAFVIGHITLFIIHILKLTAKVDELHWRVVTLERAASGTVRGNK